MTLLRRKPLVAAFALFAALVVAIPLLGTSRASAADSQVSIVHGIPNTPVDVYAGPTKILSDFQPLTISPTLSVPAGDLPVTVTTVGGDPTVAADVLIQQTLPVPSGANVSVVANVEGGVANLQAFANDLSPVAEGSSRVTVRHTANAPTVDIAVNGTVAIPALAMGAEASAVLPAGTYDFAVQVDGTTVLDLPDTAIPAGKNVIVYAVGNAFPGCAADPHHRGAGPRRAGRAGSGSRPGSCPGHGHPEDDRLNQLHPADDASVSAEARPSGRASVASGIELLGRVGWVRPGSRAGP